MAVISVLYYWGILQTVIRTIGTALAWVIGTSPAEAFVAVADVFLGPVNISFTQNNL